MRVILKKIKKFLSSSKSEGDSKLNFFVDKGYAVVGDNSNIKEVSLDIRSKDIIKPYLKIGSDSLIKGRFVFENEAGNISIGDRTFIGGGRFISINNIKIGNDVLISWGCTLMDNNAHSIRWSERKNDVKDWKKGVEEGRVGKYKNWENVSNAPIIIKDKVWIGFETVILKGVTIGEGAVVGSKSVVTKDVPDWTVVAGNPAIIVREIPEEDR